MLAETRGEGRLGVAAEALGVQRCWAFPTQAPQGPADRPGGAAGLTVLTSGLIPARVWGGLRPSVSC